MHISAVGCACSFLKYMDMLQSSLSLSLSPNPSASLSLPTYLPAGASPEWLRATESGPEHIPERL